MITQAQIDRDKRTNAMIAKSYPEPGVCTVYWEAEDWDKDK